MTRISSLIALLLAVAVVASLTGCGKDTTERDSEKDVVKTEVQTKESVSESDDDTDEPEEEKPPKNMDTSNANVKFDLENGGINFRFRNDNTGLLITSRELTFNEENKTFTMEDGREIKLVSENKATVDGEKYSYEVYEFPESNEIRYIFKSETDDKQLTAFISTQDFGSIEFNANRLVVHLAFNYEMDENNLTLDFDYKFYGKRVETYTAEYILDEYRGEFTFEDVTFRYTPYTVETYSVCNLYSDDYSKSFDIYENGKGKYDISAGLFSDDELSTFTIMYSDKTVNIKLIDDKYADVNGEIFDYTITTLSVPTDVYEFFSDESSIQYRIYVEKVIPTPPNGYVIFDITYEFDGSTMNVDFGGNYENFSGEYDNENNAFIFNGEKFDIVGNVPAVNVK